MKRWLATAAIIACALAAPAANAASVCYITHGDTVYSSYAFRHNGEEQVKDSPQGKAFGDFARRHYGLPAEAEVYCRSSGDSVEEENSARTEGSFTMHGVTVNEVKTSFQPKSD